MGLLDKFTGKEVQQKVDEFAEVYGTVLLGIDKEMAAQKDAVASGMQRIGEQQREINSGLNELRIGLNDIEVYRGFIKKYYSDLTDAFARSEKSQAETGQFIADMDRRVKGLEKLVYEQQTKMRSHKVAIGILLVGVLILTIIWTMK